MRSSTRVARSSACRPARRSWKIWWLAALLALYAGVPALASSRPAILVPTGRLNAKLVQIAQACGAITYLEPSDSAAVRAVGSFRAAHPGLRILVVAPHNRLVPPDAYRVRVRLEPMTKGWAVQQLGTCARPPSPDGSADASPGPVKPAVLLLPEFRIPKAPMALPLPAEPIAGLEQPELDPPVRQLTLGWKQKWTLEGKRVLPAADSDDDDPAWRPVRVADVAAELGDEPSVLKLVDLERRTRAARSLGRPATGLLVAGAVLSVASAGILRSETSHPGFRTAANVGLFTGVPLGITGAIMTAACAGKRARYRREAFAVGKWYDQDTVEGAIRLHNARVEEDR